MDVRKDMEKVTSINGEELIPASAIGEDGVEKAVAIPSSLLKGEKGDTGEPGPAGQDGYVTKEMWEEAIGRIEALEQNAVQIAANTEEQK